MARKGKSARVYARRKGEYDGDDDVPMSRSHQYNWWECESGIDAASRCWAWVDRHRTAAAGAAMYDLLHEAIYRGLPLNISRATAGGQYLLLRSGALLNLNIVMSMVDTATARLTKRRPMAQISADDAGYSEKLFGKECSRVLRRKMGGTLVEKASPKVVRDMCIRGDGVWKVERFGRDVRPVRIPVYEIVRDQFEEEQGDPRTRAHVRPMDRERACARWPKFKDRIMAAPVYNRTDPWAQQAYQMTPTHDYIEVCEAWHLPCEPGAGDGQKIVIVRGGANAVIERCVWRRQRFPLATCQWSPPTRGTGRGSGLVEQLAGIQEQINDILRDAREGLKHGSQLTIFVQRGANVDKHHLRARHPKVIEHDGMAPAFVAPNPVSEQAIRMLLLLIEQAYQISGISQMAAQSKNTLGANASGKAIDTLDDLQSDRFAHVEADYQQMRVELGTCLVDEARDLYMEAFEKYDADDSFDESPDPVPKDKLAAWIRNLDWSRVDIDEGNYHLTLEPVNFLSDNRAGRFSQVAELGKNGLIPDPSIQADLFDEPDIQRANRMILGPKHRIDRVMEDLANPKVPLFELQPDQYMNLALGVLVAKGELNEVESHRRPGVYDEELDVVCDRYRQWIELAKQEIQRAESGAPAPSLPGMQPTSMGPAPNAMTLQPGLAPDPMAGVAPPVANGIPPGIGVA